MKYIVRLFLLLVCYCSPAGAQQLNTPLLITGRVFNSDGLHIKKEDLQFRVFIKGDPQIYLNQDDVSCGYNPPFWYAELGNLAISWTFGDPLIIIIEDSNNHETARFSWPIDSTARVPDIQTQPVIEKELITQFRLTDKGVFHNEPLKFIFNSVLTELADVELKIYSPLGKEVFKSNNPEIVDLGQFQFTWNGKSDTGKLLLSGMYYYFFYVEKRVLHSGVITLKNE